MYIRRWLFNKFQAVVDTSLFCPFFFIVPTSQGCYGCHPPARLRFIPLFIQYAEFGAEHTTLLPCLAATSFQCMGYAMNVGYYNFLLSSCLLSFISVSGDLCYSLVQMFSGERTRTPIG